MMTSPIAVLPLDDRPVGTRHLQLLGDVSGRPILIPPKALLGATPGGVGDRSALHGWLKAVADDASALVISFDQLVHGGYVPMRRTGESFTQWQHAIDVLRELRIAHPTLPVVVTAVLLRTLDAETADTEPPTWARHGRRFAELSADIFRQEARGGPEPTSDIPTPLIREWLRRRFELHRSQLELLRLVEDGTVTSAMIGVEDSTAESVSSSERGWLEAWVRRLGLTNRVLVYPGGDELTAVGVAQCLTAADSPRLGVLVDSPAALSRVADFEDVPLRRTLSAQIRAAGLHWDGALTDASADMVLAVFATEEQGDDVSLRNPAREHPGHRVDPARLALFVDALHKADKVGRIVAVADIAHANGSCPVLVEALAQAGLLSRLGGYAGWNTAGNSIGSALAQGVSTWVGTRAAVEGAAKTTLSAVHRMVAHHVLDSWGYQYRVRPQLALMGGTAQLDVNTALPALMHHAAADLVAMMPTPWGLMPSGTRLPWGRLFEVDFDLTHTKEPQ